MAQPPARCSKLPRIPGSLLELRIVPPSRYQRIVRRPKKLEAVANLPGLDAVAWYGRRSLVNVPDAPFVTFVDATIRT